MTVSFYTERRRKYGKYKLPIAHTYKVYNYMFLHTTCFTRIHFYGYRRHLNTLVSALQYIVTFTCRDYGNYKAAINFPSKSNTYKS